MTSGNDPERDKPIGARWRPVRDLDPGLRGLRHNGAREAAVRGKLEDPSVDRSAMDIWLREQRRAFAIETGQIEGLYLLLRGVTENLIAEGFEGVRGTHSVTGISDGTLKGLLTDQEAALEMLFARAGEERSLNGSAIKERHALLTRHQRPRQPGSIHSEGGSRSHCARASTRSGRSIRAAKTASCTNTARRSRSRPRWSACLHSTRAIGALASLRSWRRPGCTMNSSGSTRSRTATAGSPAC